MAGGGGVGTDKRFDQRALRFPAIHWIIREVLRDYEGSTRPSKISPGGHALASLSLSSRSPGLSSIVVSHESIYKMVPTYRRRPVDKRLSLSRELC